MVTKWTPGLPISQYSNLFAKELSTAHSPSPIKLWTRSDVETPSSSSSSTLQTMVLIILNQPLPPIDKLKHLWELSSLKICADGGANRLFEQNQ